MGKKNSKKKHFGIAASTGMFASGDILTLNGREFVALGLDTRVDSQEFYDKLPADFQEQLTKDVIGGISGVSVFSLNYADFPVYFVHSHVLADEKEHCAVALIRFFDGAWQSGAGSPLLEQIMTMLTEIYHVQEGTEPLR